MSCVFACSEITRSVVGAWPGLLKGQLFTRRTHAMIHEFLSHHIARAERGEIKNAIRDCHARGVDSIVLHDEPGNRIRLFIANSCHDLGFDGHYPKIAVHAHHCDLRLIRVYGHVWDYRFRGKRAGNTYHEFAYISAINRGRATFRRTGARVDFDEPIEQAVPFTGLSLRANEYHSIVVPRGGLGAWLVIEGAEDPDYDSVCYSRSETPPDLRGLYAPMAVSEIERVLRKCRYDLNASGPVADAHRIR